MQILRSPQLLSRVDVIFPSLCCLLPIWPVSTLVHKLSRDLLVFKSVDGTLEDRVSHCGAGGLDMVVELVQNSRARVGRGLWSGCAPSGQAGQARALSVGRGFLSPVQLAVR